MILTAPTCMSDCELLVETRRVIDADRRTTAELLALLAEIDARKLYRGEGHSSLFTYCTQALRLSEPAACKVVSPPRELPGNPLHPHQPHQRRRHAHDHHAARLTPKPEENHEALLDAARHKSKRDVERLVAAIDPQPDVCASIRREPMRAHPASQLLTEAAVPTVNAALTDPELRQARDLERVHWSADQWLRCGSTAWESRGGRTALVDALPREAHGKSEDASQAPTRAGSAPTHIPGDPAAIIDRALTVLIGPRSFPAKATRGRRVPAAVRRAVWARDEGRCAFIGRDGRCPETGLLEFHHVVPFAAGGEARICR